MVKIKDTQFCVKNLKMKRKKGENFFYLPERGFEHQIFSNFSAHDLNFQRREFDEIKSKQASERDTTLPPIQLFRHRSPPQ